MKKKLIRLTENDLKYIIRESVNEVINEGFFDNVKSFFGGNSSKQQQTQQPQQGQKDNWFARTARSYVAKQQKGASKEFVQNVNSMAKKSQDPKSVYKQYLDRYGEILRDLQQKGDTDNFNKVRNQMIQIHKKYLSYVFQERYDAAVQTIKQQHPSMTLNGFNAFVTQWINNEMQNVSSKVSSKEEEILYVSFLKGKLVELQSQQSQTQYNNGQNYQDDDYRKYL